MPKLSLRGYVWTFWLYCALAINSLMHFSRQEPAPHLEHSFFYTLFPSVIGPALVIVIFLSWLPEFKNALIKAVLILSAAAFASSILFALHHFEYLSFGIPHWVSTCFWLLATILLGFRTDQLLKKHSQEIEAN